VATRSRGWTLYRDVRKGVYFVRFRHAEVRWKRSTRESDRAKALVEAARIYDGIVNGERPKPAQGKAPPLERAFAHWLEAFGASHAERTTKTYEDYATVFLAEFRSLPLITTPSIASYARKRLLRVKATTVRKELSALRSFLAWCVEVQLMTEAPVVVSIPKRAVGTKGTWADGADREQRRIDMTPAQVDALIAALPERSRRGHPSRDIVALIWETTLRIATIQRLEAPRHYTKGADTLRITADIDKVRYARDVPLSARAREILNRHCPKSRGLLFGSVRLHGVLGPAALVAGIAEDDAPKVSPHDIRHAALTHLTSMPGVPLAGAAYLGGHKHVSTTALYVHAAKSAAEVALNARNGTPVGTPRRKMKKSLKRAKKKSPLK
jgi:integrase